jgi:two-component system cell cycle sensor histidine kinase/response regulator CckA
MSRVVDELISAFRCTFFPVQVLVVDDDVATRASMRRVLERQGYTTIVAEDAEDALRVLERTHVPVDLLVTDIQMPGMSGDRLAARVRESWPELPVLFVSGDERNAAVAAAAGGRSKFLAKPFLPIELSDAVQLALDPQASASPTLLEPLA